jgi:hypothetical protein
VIDPVIQYSTYFGTTGNDQANAVAADSSGNVYIAGNLVSGGVQYGFVSKLNPAGSAILYTVYLGSGSCNADARGNAVDSGGNAIVTGYFTSFDEWGYCNDKQVLGAKINPAGNAVAFQEVWGGYEDYGNAVAVDAAGNSSNNAAATVPASVTVAAGASSATFTVTSKVVTAASTASINAAYNGTTKSATLTVNPTALSSVTVSPASVTGGTSSTGTVTLTGPAPTGGVVVTLTSSNTSATAVPASVTVAANAKTATSTVTTKTVTAATSVTITGTYSGVSKTAALTVN